MSQTRFACCLAAVVGLIGFRGVRGDVAPVTPDAPISSTAQTALDVSQITPELAKVGPEVDKLVQNPTNPAIVSMVRNWLINQDPTTASNPFQGAYTQALNTAFINALNGQSVPINSKLNMGIVIASLVGPKTNLAPTVLKLIQDPNTIVALQGLKAASAMLPLALQDATFNNGLRGPILSAIVAIAANHPDGLLAGQIAGEAYRAINPRLWYAGAIPTGDSFAALIDANLKLQESRLEIYKNTGIPPFPKADTFASYLLLSTTAWPVMTDAQKTQAVQQAIDLISYSGQRYSGAAQNLQNNRDLIESLQSEGEWIRVLGGILNDQNISQVGTDVNHLNPASTQANVKATCDAVFGAFQANQSFSTLTQPPTIAGGTSSQPSQLAAPEGGTPGSSSSSSSGAPGAGGTNDSSSSAQP